MARQAQRFDLSAWNTVVATKRLGLCAMLASLTRMKAIAVLANIGHPTSNERHTRFSLGIGGLDASVCLCGVRLVNFLYKKSGDPGFELYTVGFYEPGGEWNAESDHCSVESAVERVRHLNSTQSLVQRQAIPDMSIRDWFAGMALSGLASLDYRDTAPNLAAWSYEIADAMLALRAGHNRETPFHPKPVLVADEIGQTH